MNAWLAIYLPDVAMTLNNLAVLQSDQNNLSLAQANYEEALQIYRTLAAENPRTYLPYVATTLINVSIFYVQANPDPERLIALPMNPGRSPPRSPTVN